MSEPAPCLNPVVFLVRRYDPEDAPDARIEFSPISVEAFLAHEILKCAEMTGQTRRRIREEADTVHEIRVDTGPIIGLHVVFRPGLDGGALHLTPFGRREPIPVWAASIFANTEYRVDADRRRERAVTRVLDVYGIPPSPLSDGDEVRLATLAPDYTTPPKKRPRKYRPKPPAPPPE